MTDPAHPASPGTGAVSRGPRAASPDPNAAPRSGAPADAPHIGGLLVAKGVVSEDQIRIATIEQKRRQEPLGRILVRFGFATESVIRDVLAGVLGYDTIDLSNVVIDGEVVKLVPKEIARRYRVLPLTWDAAARRLTVATPDPFNVIALDQVRGLFEPGVGGPGRARGRGGDRQGDRSALRARAVGRRHPEGDRDRRDRSAQPRGGERRIQPAGGAAGQRLALRRGQAGRVRRPLRAGARVPAHPLPHRRRAAPDPQPVCNHTKSVRLDSILVV